MNIKRLIYITTGVIFITLFSRYILLAGAPYIGLRSAPQLSSAISQSLVTSGTKASIPIPGQDFTIESSKYFDNKAWAVVKISQNKSKNSAFVVLHQIDNAYRIVLGPGTDFSSNVYGLPGDVINYLSKAGLQ